MASGSRGGKSTVLIFGKTGDGKSTLANMLVSRALSASHKDKFRIGDGMDGVTTKCKMAEGNNYKVIDTVGLGEDETGRKTAEDIILEFLNRTKHEYSHVIFVKDACRMDNLDRAIWQIFLKIFGSMQPAFVVVISKTPNPPEQWFAKNHDMLLQEYSECNRRFVCVDFPPIDRELEFRNQKTREDSLQHLLNYLDQMRRENGYRTFRPEYFDFVGAPLRRYSSGVFATMRALADKFGITLTRFANSLGIMGSVASIAASAATCAIL
ncbi:hypothetical protein M758_1G003400 [Ceratodon purpureus]|nr:hypothetical protein M758_1G003400 [Ceratodon purpureus]